MSPLHFVAALHAAIVGLFLVVTPAAAQERIPQFEVTGRGHVAQAPDMATISLGVTQQGETAAEALALMREGSAAVFGALAPFEIAPRDLQTSQLQLHPQWERYTLSGGGDRQRIAGYVATNQVTVRVRDLTELGAIMDAVAENGANQFQGLQFGFADPDPLQEQALASAIKAAQRKARMMAEATGVGLGRILSMREGSSGALVQIERAEASFARSAIPTAVGESQITATFTITYEIIAE